MALAAGVSQSTVARVYARPNLVSADTRAKVRHAAESIGYVPSAIAGGMRKQKSGLIGVVVPATGEYWQGVISEFARQVGDSGRQLLVTNFRDAGGVNTAIQSISRYRLDGLVLASSAIGVAQIARLSGSTTPVIAFNQPAATGIAPTVAVDNKSGSATIAEHLLHAGVRSAAFVGGVAAASTDQLRYRGASETFNERGVLCPYVEAGAFSYEAGFKLGASAVRWERLPDAIMASADELAFGVLDGLRMCGCRVPDDVLVTGFDGLPQSAWEGYRLTTLVQPIEQLVKEALVYLTDPVGLPAIVVDGALRIGGTTSKEAPHG